MALPVGGGADSDLFVKSLTELTIGPDHGEPQEATNGEFGDEEDENGSVYFSEEILQVGHMKKRRSDGGNRKSGVLPPAR